MKLSDFEKCVQMMGLELISVTLSSKTGDEVKHAMAVKNDGKKKVEAYNWYYGCCRKSINKISYNDIKENIALYNAKAPLSWSPFANFNIPRLQAKYFECLKENV